MSISHLSFDVREKDGLKDIYRQVYREVCSDLRKDENIALYWEERERTELLDTTWKLTISSEKEDLLKDKMSETLNRLKSDENSDATLRTVAADIFTQLESSLITTPTHLRQSENVRQPLRCEICEPPVAAPTVPKEERASVISYIKGGGR